MESATERSYPGAGTHGVDAGSLFQKIHWKTPGILDDFFAHISCPGVRSLLVLQLVVQEAHDDDVARQQQKLS